MYKVDFFSSDTSFFPHRSPSTHHDSMTSPLSTLGLWGPFSLFSPAFPYIVCPKSYSKQETICHFHEHVMFTNALPPGGNIVPFPLQFSFR